MSEDDDFLDAHRRGRRIRIALAVGALAVIGGGVAAFVLTRTPSVPAVPDARPDVAALEQAGIERARDAARAAMGTACSGAQAREGLTALLDGDWAGVVQLIGEWEARCPVDERLRWKLYDAHEELGEWAKAEAVATWLLNANAIDTDYWWWRGKARKHLDLLDASGDDYLQSLALSRLADSNGVHVAGLADVAPVTGRTCDAAFALRWYGHRREGGINRYADSKLASLEDAGRCGEQVGRIDGAEVALPVRTPTTFTIGGASIRGEIDPHVPYVLIDAATAKAAKIDPTTARPIELVRDARVQRARLVRATVAVGGLTADNVEVAVFEELPASAMRIGLSFLWRFDMEWADGDERMVARPITDVSAL